MKNYILLSLIFLSKITFSQLITTVCDNVPYQITSTDWQNPYNANLPQSNGSYFNADYFKNRYDWNDQNGFDLVNMQFAGIPLGDMSTLSNTQLGAYYDYIYYESPAHKHLFSEGWELLLINVGKFPDKINDYTSTLYKALPYVVLYNRYRGLIRVFVGMGPDATVSTSPDALNVRLSFKTAIQNNLTGLLRLYEGCDQALDQKTDVKDVGTISKAVSEQSRWASADFQIAYDPCTCNTPSEIQIIFTHIKSHTLSLTGRSLDVTDNDILTNEMDAYPRDFLSGYSYDKSTGATSGGIVIDKYIENIIAEYDERYTKYQNDCIENGIKNKKIDDNLAFLKLAKHAIAIATTLSGGFNSTMLPFLLKTAGASFALDYLATGNGASSYTAEEMDWYLRSKKAIDGLILKEGAEYEKLDEKKLFDNIKKIIGGEAATFISNNFEKQANPSQPSKPTNSITYSEMTFGGQITEEVDKVGPTIFVPGTFGEKRAVKPSNTTLFVDDVFKYPVYNEILGVFALLESPKIKISKSITDTYSKREEIWLKKYYSYEYLNEYYINSELYKNWTVNYQFQLMNDLKYAINNALDVKKSNIKYSLIISAKTNKVNSSSITFSYIDPSYTTNIETNDKIDVNSYEKLYGSNDIGFNEGINHFYPSITNSNGYTSTTNFNAPQYSLSNLNELKSNIKLSTPFISLNNQSMISSIGVKNEEVRTKATYFYDFYDETVTPYEQNKRRPRYKYEPTSFDMTHDKPIDFDPLLTGIDLKDFDIKLVLLIDIEFNTLGFDGKPNTVTISNTYNIASTDIINLNQDIYTNLENSSEDYFQYKENLTLDETQFSGQNIEGCKLENNIYTCRAINDIIIEGSLSTSNGYNVNVIAGNEISVVSATIVSPEVILSISPVLSSPPTKQVSQSYLSGFCNGSNGVNASSYQARNPSAKILSALAEEEARKKQSQNSDNLSWDFNLYPNPTTKETNLTFTGNFNESLEIHVFDVTGSEVLNSSVLNENRTSIDVSKLNKGLYFVGVISNGVTKTKQLIIQ